MIVVVAGAIVICWAESARLLAAMRTARYDALICGAAAGDALQKAIDAPAEELTGDPEFYWNKPAEGRSA